MFNRSLVIRMLGNGYLALVGLAILFAGFLSTIALIEVDQLGETGEGFLHAAYETLNCFGTVFAAWVFTIVLVVGGLGLLVYAVLRLYDNAYEAKFPPRTNNASPLPNYLL
jgi:hypothetical protein